MSDRYLTKITKALFIVIGIGVAFLSLNPGLIIRIMALAMGLMTASFTFPLILGCHWRRINEKGAFSGMILGFFTTEIVHPITPIFAIHPEYSAGLVGAAVCIASMVIISLLTSPPKEKSLKFFGKMHS